MSEDSDKQPGWQFWIDRGGTFTDVIAMAPDGTERTRKLRSDAPELYDDAAVASIEAILAASPTLGRHIDTVRIGTTVATNALLERKAPPVGLLLTQGFADLLEIADQRRSELFGLKLTKREVPVARVLTTSARISAAGEVLSAHDLDALDQEFRRLVDEDINHLAISLLHNWQHPQHELEAKRLALAAGIEHVTCSHETTPVQGYLQRTETTWVDTWLTPVLQGYLQRFKTSLAKIASVTSIDFMQSHGGLDKAHQVRGKDAVLSGPAGGLVALAHEGAGLGLESLIGMDMGGTSTDICHWQGRFEQRTDNEVGGYRLHTPMLRLDTIASGGGSLLECEDGRLQVGPESAGAQPGPAAYGLGGPATLTDANVVLGRLPAEVLPKVFGRDGDQRLDPLASRAALDRLRSDNTEALGGYSLEALAQRWIDIGVEQVAGAAHQLALRHGSELKRFVLGAFGGAAGQIACAVATRLDIEKIWLHPRAGVLSALGIGIARHRRLSETSVDQPLSACWSEIARQRDARLSELGAETELETSLLVSVAGSDGVLEVDWGSVAQIDERFAAAHLQRFGVRPRGALHVKGVRFATVGQTANYQTGATQSEADIDTTCRCWFGDQWLNVRVCSPQLLTEEPTPGPIIVADAHTTVWVEPGWAAKRDVQGHLLLVRRQSSATAQRVEASDSTTVDPALLEIFNRRFTLVAEHMGHVLEKTAQSVNIRERLDYSCALFDATARLIANAPHMPVHLGSMGASVQHVLDSVPDLAAGDVYLINSPYAGGTHLPDITAVRPWFNEQGQLKFFLASRAHHADVGGLTPGSMPAMSRSIDEEGILFENFPLVREGELRDQALLEHLGAGRLPARAPDRNLSDLRAQLASLQEGSDQLNQLIEHFGESTVTRYMHHVFDNARGAVSRIIHGLSGGQATVVLDDDSRVQVALKTSADRLVVDFSGTSPQHPTNFNAPSAVARASVLYFMRVMANRDIPLNDGCLADVELRVPSGSMLDPQPPAAVVAGNVETSQAITNALFAAAGVLAHGQGTMNNLTFGNERVQYYETIAGGSGAGDGFDGAAVVQTHMTNSRCTDPEILESRLPVRLLEFSLRHGSGGCGRWSGGDGAIRRIEALEPMSMSILSSNRTQRPHGLEGGDPGTPGANRIIRKNGQTEDLAGVASADLDVGDRIEILTPGGGGFGRPD
ncbi:MAG: hydantoinase B/oxoprolinase family protein [Pseudomonadota bacterium]